MKRFYILILLFLVGLSFLKAKTQLTVAEMNSLYTISNGSWISVHDPSVVYRNGSYYIWGSHLGVARSSDLVSYTGLSAGNTTFALLNGTTCNYTTAFNTQAVTQVKNYAGTMVTFPNIDAESWCSWYDSDKEGHISGNMWAPDIIYNETMGKWCMYLSLNGDHWASVIILLTAPSATGPFTYQGPVVMGGFTGGTHGDNNMAAPSYEGTDIEIALGPLSSLPSRYNQKGSWGTYWPNCIDPCVFFDEAGELWMTYGSWSGGIFMLKLDKETGLRDYTYIYESDYDAEGANGTSDPYFGKKIAGGYYVSGEGSYIQHIGDYYYLFMSYGFYSPDGGYEMRVFRSQNPDGPYVDATGTAATYTGYQMNYGPTAITNRGMRLTGAYNNWGNQTVGECAQGHNSACTDGQGRSYVVYHTKFNDGTVGHQVRTHQLFVNEKGWLVEAPFCFRGETTTDADIAAGCAFATDEIVGTYHFMLHPYKLNYSEYEETTPREVTLNADGSVTGDYTGTWSMTDGTGYLTIKVGSTYYYGVVVEQTVNGSTTSGYKTTSLKAIAFSAVASNGVAVWGYKLQPQYAVAYNYLNNTIPVKEGVTYSSNISLMFKTTDNTVLTWTSSEPDVISETGKYNPRDTAVAVTLTARLECGDYYWEQSYNVKAQKKIIPGGDYLSGLVAYYDMDSSPCYNAYNTAQRTTFATSNTSTGTKPVLSTDYERMGSFVHQAFGAQGSNSFTRMTNPLKGSEGLTGFTVSMWVKRSDDNAWDAIWSFFNGTSAAATGPRLYLTGNNYIGYNDNNGTWFDINYAENAYTDIPVGQWTLVTITVGLTNGVRTYINGANKAAHTLSASNGATIVKNLPISAVLEKVASFNYFYLGLGSFWGSADCCIDDVMIYNRELSATDVRALNTMENRVSDFTIGEGGTGIEDIEDASLTTRTSREGVYDLTGRQVTNPTRGLYIINGKKVLIK